jgi:hypothetical protein
VLLRAALAPWRSLAAASAVLATLELAVLLGMTHYLVPMSLRAVVLAVGLWLLGEVVWLRWRKWAARDDQPEERLASGPFMLRSFALRSLIGLGWAVGCRFCS